MVHEVDDFIWVGLSLEETYDALGSMNVHGH